ncbi:MAG: 5-deoxy-glucuronate isomerase [Actinomycetota bacterium]|nr:5-deoxy-glucuronate isomerase [Actinomycetota bacterium]
MRLHYEDGALADGACAVALSQARAGWRFSSLWVVALEAGGRYEFATGPDEIAFVPLAGSAELRGSGGEFRLEGRRDVFDGPTDWVYLPRDATAVLESPVGGRFALCGARADGTLEWRHHPAESVAVELRGAGSCSRRVTNYAMAEGTATRLLVCEVVTPAGNWSSYPPHKHDEHSESERELEEIYYFEVAPGPSGDPGMAYQRLYGTPERPVELCAEVRSGDVVLIPHGYHGPAMAPPGYDLYYLNVMAGPGARQWLASDDPAHAFVRESWASQAIDARLVPGGRLGSR